MKLEELREGYLGGYIDKRLYWQIARENYTHILPELQKVIAQNGEVDSVIIGKDGVVLRKASGVLNYFDFTQSICRAEGNILMEGDLEKDDMAYINDYLSGIGHGTVLDIGANVGIFSLDFYHKHNDFTFYLFEPVPATYLWLEKNAVLNAVDSSRYRPFNIGMSDKRGSFDFYVPASNEAASLVANEDPFYRKKCTDDGIYTGDTEIDRTECEVDTVDLFVSEHGVEDVRFIKIDVEGNEKYVLKGAEETLKKYKPLVYCELLRKHAKRFGYHPNEVIDFMKGLGYGCYTVQEREIHKVKEITEETVETNFFFGDEGEF